MSRYHALADRSLRGAEPPRSKEQAPAFAGEEAWAVRFDLPAKAGICPWKPRGSALGIFLALLALGLLAVSHSAQAAGPAPVALHWLDAAPPDLAQGVSWGVPWPRGAVRPGASFQLTGAAGSAIPVQTWPMAYWPDGSLKWTGNAAALPAGTVGPLTVSVGGASPAPIVPLQVSQTPAAIQIVNGGTTCVIPKSGPDFIGAITVGGRVVAERGRLVCLREDRSQSASKGILREVGYTSRISRVTLEQSGPVRAVVKIAGMHQSDLGHQAWLPFIIRLYFYSGVDSIKMVHTFIFDGDQHTDFIKGLGIRFSVPMHGQAQNRQVRFGGDTGMFAEPLRLIAGRRDPGPALYAQQIAGQPVPNLQNLPDGNLVAQMAVWDSYKLSQSSSDSYTIRKRTNPQSAWVRAAFGGHALGMAFVGDPDGGLAVGMKDFWQLEPTELEVQHAATPMADLTVWLWSPDVPAMDLRFYDTRPHGLDMSYEDVLPNTASSTATGVARTTNLTLWPCGAVPTDATLVSMAKLNALPPHLMCTPDYYHSVNIFGPWSLVNTSTPLNRQLEDRLNLMFSFYQGEVQRRRWYGFWDYGDVMHTYDPTRHSWMYDVGGFAWDNTELMPDLWLWYSFLRTGRADVFRMADALTRQSQEVDVYHLGPYAGLGSRHNVVHWGDGAKEDRIGQAIQKRFYYYLTTDERTGDLMQAEANVDLAVTKTDPLREIFPKTQYPTHVRLGPDWLAFAGNWMTAWERTGDTKYRDKIITGMKALAAMPGGLLTTLDYGYDPKTNMLYDIPTQQMKVDHFVWIFGGAETEYELQTLVNVPAWNQAWLTLCRQLGTGDGARLSAQAAQETGDAALGQRAWDQILEGKAGAGDGQPTGPLFPVFGPNLPRPMEELDGLTKTNGVAQSSLNIIECLETAGNFLPKDGSLPVGKVELVR